MGGSEPGGFYFTGIGIFSNTDKMCAKKGRNRFDPKSFLYNWESFREQSALVVLPLDIDCLLRSLFEYSEEGIAMNLWGQAIAPGLTSERLIGRIVRRLALRPSIENWWEDELYDEMEAWYEW